jgi:hypothetical protein
MIGTRHDRKGSGVRVTILGLLLAVPFLTSAQSANDITGSARNESRGQAAVGDKVILIRLDRGMEEEAQTRTGQRGAFRLHVGHAGKAYLVRVVHEGVSYDQRADAGDDLSIPVFDALPRVPRVSASIEILRAGTNGNLLHVSDMYELKNESSPPVTQAGGPTFEVYVPANAKMDSVLAAGPAKIGVLIPANPAPGEPGHYTVSFPLRPGETKFAFNYDLPYEGRAVFQTRLAYPLEQLAVMIPPSMKFSSHSRAFAPLPTGRSDYQVLTVNQLEAGEGPGFELSGTGGLPSLGDQAKSQAGSLPLTTPEPTAPATDGAVLSPFRRVDPQLQQTYLHSQSLVLGGLTAVLLGVCALLVWRARKARSTYAVGTTAPPVRAKTSIRIYH